MTLTCPLCQNPATEAFTQDKYRAFAQCGRCSLVFAEPDSWLDPGEEKALYDLHENSLEDDGYNRFLSRIVEPLVARIVPPAQVLDFGCGPARRLPNSYNSSASMSACSTASTNQTPVFYSRGSM